jgi:hypothetical protein
LQFSETFPTLDHEQTVKISLHKSASLAQKSKQKNEFADSQKKAYLAPKSKQEKIADSQKKI